MKNLSIKARLALLVGALLTLLTLASYSTVSHVRDANATLRHL